MIFDRNVFAELTIAVAICVGGWMLCINPQVQELRELEDKIVAATASPMLSSQQAIEKMARRMQEVRMRVAAIESHNRLMRDPGRIYDLIMKQAEERQVTIEQLSPTSSRGNGEQQGPVQMTTYNLRVLGPYEGVVAFVRSLDEIEGFIRPVTLTLAPTPQEKLDLIEGRITFEAAVFELPKVLAAMAGSDHGNQ